MCLAFQAERGWLMGLLGDGTTSQSLCREEEGCGVALSNCEGSGETEVVMFTIWPCVCVYRDPTCQFQEAHPCPLGVAFLAAAGVVTTLTTLGGPPFKDHALPFPSSLRVAWVVPLHPAPTGWLAPPPRPTDWRAAARHIPLQTVHHSTEHEPCWRRLSAPLRD